MNFFELVLQGFFNENNREFLDRYFYREYKKAEKESFYEAVEFFKGCLDVTDKWKDYLKTKVFERQNELYLIIEEAENGTLKYSDLGGKSIEQKNKETIENCNTELSTISEYNYYINLLYLTNGRIAHHLHFSEVLRIKEAILEAYRITKIEADSTTRDAEIDKISPKKPKTITEQETIEMKPVLKLEAVQMVFDILKDFFSPEQQIQLRKIIETGNNTSKKLLFMDNGNRLTDTFKKLIEHDFIIGCQKQHLENWVVENFLFLHNGTKKEFKPRVVNKYISAGINTVGCKSPLIEIRNGQIQKVERPRTKKHEK